MGDPMRIRAANAGGVTEVKILMRHDMETGQRKDAAGKTIPAHYITSITAVCNGKTVLDGSLGPAISKDPFLSFKFKGGNKGDKVAVTWKDNKGGTRTDETTIA